MNSQTQKALVKFVDAVEDLATGVAREIGMEKAGEILQAGEELKEALGNDETIKEAR